MNKKINQLRSGVVLSYINLLLGSVIPFFYTPVMLRMLGAAEHGLYSISGSVIGYLGLLSFGLGSAVVRYIAKYRAEGNKEAIEKIMGFFLVLHCLIGLLMMVGGWFAAENVEALFHKGLTGPELEKTKLLILIMTINTAVSFPLSAFSSVVVAYERYVFRRVADIFTTVAMPCANLTALYMGFGSVGMAATSLVVGALTLPLNVVYCFHVLHIKPKFARIPGALVREIMGFSFFVFLGTIVDMMFWATDKIILGMLAGSVAVSVYQIGSTFNQMLLQLSTSISSVLTPKITGMVVKNASHDELTELFIRVGRMQFLVVALVVTGFISFGQSFIALWAGPAYAQSYWIALLALVPLSIPLIQNTGLSIITAQNKHQFRSIVYFLIAILNVISTYLVVPYWGGIGAVFCSFVSYLLGQGIIMNIYYQKKVGLDIGLFWRNILSMAVIPVVLMAGTLLVQRYIRFDGWVKFFAGVAVYTALYGGGMYLFKMNGYEKGIVRHFLRRG